MIRALVVLLLIGSLCGCATKQNRAHLKRKAPRRNARQTTLSPAGGYAIGSAKPKQKDSPAPREIIVTRPGDKGPVLRFPIQRQVEVVWAPDESALAVIDAFAVNENRVVVFALPSGRPLYELRRDDICELNPALPCGTQYSHVYFEQVGWVAPFQIQASVHMINPLAPNLPQEIRGFVVANFAAPPGPGTGEQPQEPLNSRP